MGEQWVLTTLSMRIDFEQWRRHHNQTRHQTPWTREAGRVIPPTLDRRTNNVQPTTQPPQPTSDNFFAL